MPLAELENNGIRPTEVEDNAYLTASDNVLFPLLLTASHCTTFYDDLVQEDELRRGLEQWLISCITDLGRADPEFVSLYLLGVRNGDVENLPPPAEARFQRAMETRDRLVESALELGACPVAA